MNDHFPAAQVRLFVFSPILDHSCAADITCDVISQMFPLPPAFYPVPLVLSSGASAGWSSVSPLPLFPCWTNLHCQHHDTSPRTTWVPSVTQWSKGDCWTDGKIDSQTDDGKIDSQTDDGKIDSQTDDGKIDSQTDDGKIDSQTDGKIDSQTDDGKIDSQTDGGKIDSQTDDGKIDSQTNDGKIDSQTNGKMKYLILRLYSLYVHVVWVIIYKQLCLIRLYFHKWPAQVTMPMPTSEWFFPL